jgi:hypothetical protein
MSKRITRWLLNLWANATGLPIPDTTEGDDMNMFRLGRKAIKVDTRTVKMADYLTPKLPPAPPVCNWAKGLTDFGVMLNDRLGCCTISGCGHAIQIWSVNTVKEATVPDSTILHYYEKWDGYDPLDPSSDQGGVELDVLKAWRKQGLAGHKILGFAAANIHNLEEIKQTIHLFGGSYIGMTVTDKEMQDANNPAIPWDVGGSVIGGHCVVVIGYDAQFMYFISWGKIYKMTIACWNANVDEAYGILGQDWLTDKGAPNGFNLNQLQADLSAIR